MANTMPSTAEFQEFGELWVNGALTKEERNAWLKHAKRATVEYSLYSKGASAKKIYRGILIYDYDERVRKDGSYDAIAFAILQDKKLRLDTSTAESWSTDIAVAGKFANQQLGSAETSVVLKRKAKKSSIIMDLSAPETRSFWLPPKSRSLFIEEKEIVTEQQCHSCGVDDIAAIFIGGFKDNIPIGYVAERLESLGYQVDKGRQAAGLRGALAILLAGKKKVKLRWLTGRGEAVGRWLRKNSQ